MDTKNVIAAISLSAAVIILYGLFFAPSPKEIKKLDQEKTTLTSEAPKLDTSEKLIEISREKAIKVSLAEKVLEFEKVKQLAASKLLEARQEMIDSLNDLRLEYGVPEEGYSVQLPSSPEDKVAFKRD